MDTSCDESNKSELVSRKSKLLVSSVDNSAKNYDLNLINPQGIVANEKHIWIISLESSLVIKYSVKGVKAQEISVPRPTSICLGKKNIYVSSENGNIYKIEKKGEAIASIYISVGNQVTSITFLKGLLYVIMPNKDYVSIYNENIEIKALADKSLSAIGYKPLFLGSNDNVVYVIYSDGNKIIGHGYINKYCPKKNSFSRIINRSNLTGPQGIISNNIIYVANSVNGTISIFDENGDYMSQLKNMYGGILVNDGISGLFFNKKSSKLYFCAANNSGKLGSIGYMKL
jgi:DNA-binding beta-propeller fold protein YncE